MLLIAALLPVGFGAAQIASSAPQGNFCVKKPDHWKCATASTTTGTTGTTGTTTAPPPTTTAPPPTTTAPPPTTTTTPPTTTTSPPSSGVANVWVAP